MLTELEARIEEARQAKCRSSEKNPVILAVGSGVARELRQAEATRQGALYDETTITLSSRVCGLHVLEDYELEPDAIEVR